MLSPYNLMYCFVFFDLPVLTRQDRKIYSKFRNALMDVGFSMFQYSVYIKFCGSREKMARYSSYIKKNMPESGVVSVMFFTERQYRECQTFLGTVEAVRRRKESGKKYNEPKNEQLTLF